MKLTRICAFVVCLFSLCLALIAQDSAGTTIRRVTVIGGGNNIEVEISATQAIAPATQLIANPDRLIVDVPDALPGPQVRNLAVNQGDLKGVRIGLYSSNPPITRIVLDLAGPRQYEVFPSGRTVIVKLQGPNARLMPASQPLTIGRVTGGALTSGAIGFVTGAKVMPMASLVPVKPPAPSNDAQIANPAGHLRVRFQNGNLTISADKATLAEVLFEVHKKTGADIPVPSGAEQEQVFTELGPAPPSQVLTSLLQGSPFDFLIVGSPDDPNKLRSVQLTRRGPQIPGQSATFISQDQNQPAPPQEQPQEVVQPEVQPEQPQPLQPDQPQPDQPQQ